jgi:hypothetical protein
MIFLNNTLLLEILLHHKVAEYNRLTLIENKVIPFPTEETISRQYLPKE